MTDTLSKEKRSWNMSRIRCKDTKPELMLRSMLHRAGFRFRVHERKLPGTPDIVLPRYKTIIFVNGCFWHRHKNCKYAYNPKSKPDFWQDKFSKTILRDREKIKALRSSGWKVITVWECDLQKDPDSILAKVVQNLRNEENL